MNKSTLPLIGMSDDMASRAYVYHNPETNEIEFKIIHNEEEILAFNTDENSLNLGDPTVLPDDPKERAQYFLRTCILYILYSTQKELESHKLVARIMPALFGFIEEDDVEILQRLLTVCEIRVKKHMDDKEDDE